MPTPIFYNDNEEELLFNNLLTTNTIPQNKVQPHNKIQPKNDPPPPAETIPQQSNHIAEKPPIPGLSWLERAIQDSTNAAARTKTAQAKWKKTLQALREEEMQNKIEVVKDAAIKELCQAFRTLNLREGKVEQVNQVHSAISKMTKIDLSTLKFEDEPRTWEEAQWSADAKCWEEGYWDQLKSLKQMGVYKLIPRCDVPQGSKICKGRPVFRIKWDENSNVIRL